MVCVCQASGAGVTRFAAGVLLSSRCFDVGAGVGGGFWHVPVLGCGLATSRCVAQAPGGELGSVTRCTQNSGREDSGQGSTWRRDNALDVWSLEGWHPLPLVCCGCVGSWSFAWHKVFGVNSGVWSQGSGRLMAFTPRCIGAGVKQSASLSDQG